jgi:hypothetical protein
LRQASWLISSFKEDFNYVFVVVPAKIAFTNVSDSDQSPFCRPSEATPWRQAPMKRGFVQVALIFLLTLAV